MNVHAQISIFRANTMIAHHSASAVPGKLPPLQRRFPGRAVVSFLPVLLLPLFLTLFCPCPGAAAPANEISLRETYAAYQKIPNLTDAQKEYGMQVIASMPYSSQRILRKLCGLPGMDFERAQMSMQTLSSQRFTFLQAQAFEALCDHGDMDIAFAMESLPVIRTLNYQVARSLQRYLKVQGVSSRQGIALIPTLKNMGELNNRAFQAFLGLPGMNPSFIQEGLPIIARLSDNHARAAEAYANIRGMTPPAMLEGLNAIQRLRQDNAVNARWLFADETMTPQGAWSWMNEYFTLSSGAQQALYERLNAQSKSVLLRAFYQGGSSMIWRINDLHSITDQNGYEISSAALSRYSLQQLRAKFQELPPSVVSRFSTAFASASQGQAIGLLRQATSAARVQVGRDLVPANAYAIMAQAGEFYDSSFRDIMVPILQGYINTRYQGDLLRFLKDIDPENQLVSDFIVSCAQKGKLTAFFPADSQKQKEILTLVAGSAFRGEDSILLFSATMTPLLKVLDPSARTYLITLMAQKAYEPNSHLTFMVTVILQYYLQTYPELLGADDRALVARVLSRNGAVNLERYQVTPFAEWKADGRIASLSMFHPDDDGRQSFISNANLLLKSGYRLISAPQYSVGSTSAVTSDLPALFQAMRSRHFAVAFEKQVNGIRITHNQIVYSDKGNQMDILQQFILSKDEILAQRGHSYWRTEQIIDPVKQLLEENRISHADLQGKQRFLSLGSCGGVKVYTTLTHLFDDSVDILATIGTGLALINDPYNKALPEIIASNPSSITWKNVTQQTSFIFQGGRGQDYLQPGSLTAILHKILSEMRRGASSE